MNPYQEPESTLSGLTRNDVAPVKRLGRTDWSAISIAATSFALVEYLMSFVSIPHWLPIYLSLAISTFLPAGFGAMVLAIQIRDRWLPHAMIYSLGTPLLVSFVSLSLSQVSSNYPYFLIVLVYQLWLSLVAIFAVSLVRMMLKKYFPPASMARAKG